MAGTDTNSTVGYRINYDKRNSRYKPSSGFNFEIDQELAGVGGTSYYIKNRISYGTYKRLSDRLIGAFKFQAGNSNGYNGKYAPLSSNYKLGGKRLRGFKSGKIGPRTGNSYTGGQYFYLTSLETNIDFNLDAFDITSTLFLDVGSVWGLENPAYSSIDDDHELKSSLGVNFNWDSAIGPINIIYATILESQNTDTTDNLYFDIGYNLMNIKTKLKKNNITNIFTNLLTVSSSFAEYPETIIGVIDLNFILSESKAAIDAAEQIENIALKIEEEIKETDQSLIDEQNELAESFDFGTCSL